MSIDNECSLSLLSIVSSLEESRDVVFCEIILFIHDLHENQKQGKFITEITRADGLPSLQCVCLYVYVYVCVRESVCVCECV